MEPIWIKVPPNSVGELITRSSMSDQVSSREEERGNNTFTK